MSTLLLDLGNSRLKLAAVAASAASGALDHPAALAHDGQALPPLLDAALAALPPCRGALLASVAAASLADALHAALAARGIAVQRVAVAAQHAQLRVCYADPAQFGVDRWLALLGARQRVPAAALLLASCGTALTIDLVDASGSHLGGVIAASPDLMATALRQRAIHLPAPGAPGDGFACDTAAALSSGCHGAAAALVQRCAAQARARLGGAPQLLLTGGGAPALLPLLAGDGPPPSYHAWLVLEGLAVLARERATHRA